jgi:hypothetical protein
MFWYSIQLAGRFNIFKPLSNLVICSQEDYGTYSSSYDDYSDMQQPLYADDVTIGGGGGSGAGGGSYSGKK